jgi:heme/copper-type cytochrome/quinol oxidase subunit 2
MPIARIPIETHHKLELTWTIVPLLISLGVFVWAGRLYFQMYDVPADAMEVYVIGKQWMWKFQHPETGQVEINTLHVPVNRPVKLTMTSEDVIHSFFVPAFRIKPMLCRDDTPRCGLRPLNREAIIFFARNIVARITAGHDWPGDRLA